MATDEIISEPEAEPTTKELTSYDEVPYSSHPYAHTHPYRMSVLGVLFGMQPASPDRCRVLELGCAGGGNLIPMAATLPESRFVGIDLSSVQIADGQRTVDALGLKNIELKHLSITDVDSSMGEFDYIVCHGVFSWVPEPVRRKILDICASQLTPQGIAYISYNTYPGWHMRGTVRDMMLYHSRKWDKPQEKVGHARALLDFLVKSVPESSGAYATLLRKEMELMRAQADYYVLHEHLEAVNVPMYFHEFAAQAKTSGLQFLAEAELGAMSMQGLSADIRNIVRQLAKDLVDTEQYVDFIRNRTFRRTLLCREDVTLDWRSQNKRVRALHASSPAAVEGTIDVVDKTEAKFKLPGGTLTTQNPIIKAALLVLTERWPETMPFDQLLDEALRRIKLDPSNKAQREQYANYLSENMILCLACLAQRAVMLYTTPPPMVSRAGDRPEVFRISRHQAQKEARVTSLLHELVQLGDFDRQLVRVIDGSRTQQDLLDKLAADVRSGALKPSANVSNEPAQLHAALAKALSDSLSRFGRLGLLQA
jgi:methyltransferase-like protein/cyclopropane fatty-acyl-phospholipid synthase-like methyltransferase